MAIMKTQVGRSMVGNVSAVIGTLKQLVRSTSRAGIDRDVLVLTNAKTSPTRGTRSSLRGVCSNRRSSCRCLS
jgi:hypothetical protein